MTAQGAARNTPGRLPVTVVGGFLGAGKTTLVNHLLRQATRRYAVVVNDFGSVNIDAALIAGADGGVLSLANGCICCGAGPDLGDSLARLLARHPRPEHAVIEASGVSDPWRIAQMVKLDPALRLDAVLVLVDAAAFPAQIADRYLADTLERQLARADLLVLNKCDLAGAALERTRAAVRRLRPDARLAEVAQAALPEALLAGPPGHPAPGRFLADAPDHGFRSWTWRHRGAFDAGRLAALLDRLPPAVLRLKGGCRVGPAGQPHLLQLAGRRWTLEPLAPPLPADALVLIGTPALPDDAWLDAAFRAALLPAGTGQQMPDNPMLQSSEANRSRTMLDRRTLLATGTALLAVPASRALAAADAGSLVLGMGQEPRHFNGAIQSGTATAVPGTQIFASPLRYDADWNPLPYLAKSWSVAPDALSVTLNLVEDAVFHDGTPVTSADVAFSIGVIKAHHPFTTMLAPVASVDTPDPHTAIIRLSHPHPALLLAMSPALMPILPKHIYGDGQDILTHPANLKPVGCGPFRFVEYQRGQFIRLEKFDRFFIPGRPALDQLTIRIVPDPTVMVLGLERGEVHIVPLLAGTRNIERAQRAPGLAVTAQGYAGIGPLNWLAFNCTRPPFDDPRVRQAICYAVDRGAITRVLMGGKAQEALTPIVPSSPFSNPKVQAYAPDLDRANKLLDDAGKARGADGTRFAMVIDYDPGDPEQGRNVAEFIRPQLRKIGIAADVRAVPDFPTWAQRVSNLDYDATMDEVFNWGDPVIGVARTYLSDNIRKGVVWANMQGYRNPHVDELLKNAAQEPDEGKRKALYDEFQTIVVDDAPIHFLNVVPYVTAAAKGLGNLPVSIWGAMSPLDELRWATPPQ